MLGIFALHETMLVSIALKPQFSAFATESVTAKQLSCAYKAILKAINHPIITD